MTVSTNKPSIDAILLIRLSAIGDVVMASGLIDLLRERYPTARLSWLVQPEAKDILTEHPALTDVIVWPRAEWGRLWRSLRWWRLAREINAFVKSLRARRFDLAIDVQGLLKSGVWAWLCGARERIGLGSKEGSARFMTRVVAKPNGDKKIASEYRHLAKELGLNAAAYRMRVATAPADDSFVKDLLKRRGVDGRYIVICPFTTRPQKHWFESSWIECTRKLREEFRLPIVMLGGPGDRTAAGRLATTDVIDVVGETTIRQAAALVRGAALLIGVDTALTHMGSAFEIPAIVIFGSTFPYSHTDSARTQVIYNKLDCSPCRRHPICHGAFTCMRTISADNIVHTAQRLIAP